MTTIRAAAQILTDMLIVSIGGLVLIAPLVAVVALLTIVAP